MRTTARGCLLARALALGLAATLVASPAMAGSRKHRHGHHGRGQGWDRHAVHHRHHAGCGHAYAVRHVNRHHHHRDDGVDDVWLALGLGAVGLTALALWAQTPPAPAYPAPDPYAGAVGPPVGEPIDWSRGDVTVLSDGHNQNGEFCREFQREITVGGRVERGWGIACLQEDGSWRLGP